MHQALAAQLLYRALLGNDHWKHRDTDTFRRALLLPCRNGFNLTQVRLTCIVGCLVGALTLERKAILMFQGGLSDSCVSYGRPISTALTVWSHI